MLHVHVLLVAPLGAGYMSQSGTDQHRRFIPEQVIATVIKLNAQSLAIGYLLHPVHHGNRSRDFS